MKKKNIFNICILLVVLILNSCGNKKTSESNDLNEYDSTNRTAAVADTTGFIKTEVDNTDTDSIYEGY